MKKIKDLRSGEVFNGEFWIAKIEDGRRELLDELDVPEDLAGYEIIVEEKKYGGRAPKRNDRYWYIDAEGYIQSAVWGNIDIHLTGADEKRFECGSAFWTEEEAEKELARRKAYVILKEDTKGFVPDWNDNDERKYFVGYRWGKGLVVDHNLRHQWLEGPYFATGEDARASIKVHEKEWKTWLGVEE